MELQLTFSMFAEMDNQEVTEFVQVVRDYCSAIEGGG